MPPWLSGIFDSVGASITGQAQAAADAATQAFYVLAGEMLFIGIIALAILLVLVFGRK